MKEQRRGKNVAIAGMVLQAVLSAVVLGVWMGTRSQAAMTCLWFVLAGVPLWLMVTVLFYCAELAAREATEIEEIAAHGGEQGALFERQEELRLRPAARRLALAQKYVAPVFTLLWAGIQIACGALLLRRLAGAPAPIPAESGFPAVFLVVAWVLAFLFSYYCLGMARGAPWRLLRAPGSYLLVNSILLLASAVALVAIFWRQYAALDRVVAYVIPLLQLVLSVELVLNFVLDLYRPRLPDQEQRTGFDSRLFNLIAEPGKVGHSIAETLNYQFGFEVSKTWFYQLASRALVPLVLAGAGILMGMSSVLLVRDGEVYVVRRWGRLRPETLGPGLHLKWPWPIGSAQRFEPGSVQQVLLGVGEPRTPEQQKFDYKNGLEVFEWSRPHGAYEEVDFLVAVPPAKEVRRTEEQQPPPPVNIIKLVVLLQYQVTDVYQYGYQFVDARHMLECLADRELTRYFASATLDAPAGGGAVADRPEAIMTYGRQRAAAELKKRVQDSADAMKLGVEITTVGFLGVHPPPEAAADFEKVLKSQRAQEQKRFEADAEAFKVLTENAGSPIAGLQLALAIERLDELEELQRLRADPARFAARRTEYVAQWNDRVAQLQEEVDQERREGREQAGQLTDKQGLLKAQQAHLKDLLALAGPVDLSQRVRIEANEVNRQFDRATGRPAALVAEAQAYRWSKELAERASWEALQNTLLAYQANPTVFVWDRWLGAWEDALPGLYKYVLAVDRNRVEVRMDWRQESSALVDVLPQKTEEKRN